LFSIFVMPMITCGEATKEHRFAITVGCPEQVSCSKA
jgi:hypothetical protein